LEDQLGLRVQEVKPFGLAGSVGSTPLRIIVDGIPPRQLLGKLYAQSHWRRSLVQAGRELLYGRLEDEKPFNAVRRLVQQEDYVLFLMQRANLPCPTPYGFVELTPEREYLLVTEFLDGAMELGGAPVDDRIIDDGLGIIRKLWDAGLARQASKSPGPGQSDAADRRRVRGGQAHPLAPGGRPGQHDALPCAALQPGTSLRAGPAPVHGRRDHRGVRRRPRVGLSLPVAPDAAR
jgi:hypothetical protein